MTNPRLHQAATVAKIVLARLRFLAVFLIAGLIVGYWDDIKNHVDRWTRPAVAPDSLLAARASDTEHYCAMHPNVVRAEPGNCPICSMPLIKRKKGEQVKLPEDVLARVQLSPQRVSLAGVQTTAVAPRPLVRKIHAPGTLDYNETKVAQISARVAGRADELYLQYTGQPVKAGEPLYSLYSPELYAAQREYLLARKRVNDLPQGTAHESKSDAAAVYNATMEKLVLWGVTRQQLDKMDKEFDQSGTIPSHLIVTSPIGGVVIKKDLFEGGYVNVGDRPYVIADLETLWLQAKIYERDVPLIEVGQTVTVTVDALPNETFRGTVAFRAVQIDPQTRTLDARVVVKNRPGEKGDLQLRPGMFAEAAIELPVAAAAPATRPAEHVVTATPRHAKDYLAALQPYMKAANLLVKDTTDGVPDALAELVRAVESVDAAAAKDIAAAVEQAKGKEIKAVREQFKTVSLKLIDLGKQTGLPADAPPLRVFRCPMARATWLQTATETANPYYGSSMLTCGAPVETMPKTDLLATAATTQPATAPAGNVLAVPRSSVIDTGRQKIVYVESAPGVYDMRALKLAPAAGDFYPVLEGLTEGDHVVTQGAFLIDAENRLNPAPKEELLPQIGTDEHR